MMAPNDEAKVQESQVFNIDGELKDAWGNPAEESEAVDFEESRYQGKTVPQLKKELKDREAAGREFDKSSIKTKADLIAALAADDVAQTAEAQEALDEGDGDDPDPDDPDSDEE